MAGTGQEGSNPIGWGALEQGTLIPTAPAWLVCARSLLEPKELSLFAITSWLVRAGLDIFGP